MTNSKKENWELFTCAGFRTNSKHAVLANFLNVAPNEIHVTEGGYQYKEQKYEVLTEKQAKKVAPICYMHETRMTTRQTTYIIYRVC